MELDKVITLIRAVSESSLTGFSMEEGNMRLQLEKQNGTIQILPETEREYTVPVQEEATGSRLKGEPLKSPLVGTFYTSSSPEAEPFVKAGDQVKKGQVIGIIEAMKLMNEIEAEKDGVVEAVLAENEEMVEYGQPLFSII